MHGVHAVGNADCQCIIAKLAEYSVAILQPPRLVVGNARNAVTDGQQVDGATDPVFTLQFIGDDRALHRHLGLRADEERTYPFIPEDRACRELQKTEFIGIDAAGFGECVHVGLVSVHEAGEHDVRRRPLVGSR